VSAFVVEAWSQAWNIRFPISIPIATTALCRSWNRYLACPDRSRCPHTRPFLAARMTSPTKVFGLAAARPLSWMRPGRNCRSSSSGFMVFCMDSKKGMAPEQLIYLAFWRERRLAF